MENLFAYIMKLNIVLKLSVCCIVVLPISCKQKDKSKQEPFFPVLSFIKSQVADIDTSLYHIRKLTLLDSLRSDTISIPREQFREEAKDFLTIPDLSSSKYSDRYKEEKIFDETLNRVLLTYTPVAPDKEEIQRQEVLIKPNPSGDQITNIIINRSLNSRDSAVQKQLLWKVGEGFQVTTTKQLKGQPETTQTVKVTWGENE
jgi:hypothetical protein